MADLSERLIQLRKQRNVLQKDVANAAKLSVVGYQRYEHGTRKPTSDILIALADFFDVSLDYLVGRSDDPTRH